MDTHVPPDVVSEVLPYLIDLIVGNPPELMKLLFTSPHVPFAVHELGVDFVVVERDESFDEGTVH